MTTTVMTKGAAAETALTAKMMLEAVSKTLLIGTEQVKLPLDVSTRMKQLACSVPVTSSQPPVGDSWKHGPLHVQEPLSILMSSRVPEKPERAG